jgi:superfamily I DNA/RNA helicase
LGQGPDRTGVQPHEIGVFVRSSRELRRARNAIKQAGVQAVELSERIEITPRKVSIGTTHLAKGLEFRSVAVMACDDEIIPSQGRIESVVDDADLEVVYDTERHLALRRLHPRPRSPAGDRRETGVRVPRRFKHERSS